VQSKVDALVAIVNSAAEIDAFIIPPRSENAKGINHYVVDGGCASDIATVRLQLDEIFKVDQFESGRKVSVHLTSYP